MTYKEKLFVNEYLRTGNATLSAKLAGYSAKSSSSIGYQLKNKAEIKQYIGTISLGLEMAVKSERNTLIRELIELKTSTESELVKVVALNTLLSLTYPKKAEYEDSLYDIEIDF